MQKWSPEPFTVVEPVREEISADTWVAGSEGNLTASAQLFRKDHLEGRREAWLDELPEEERTQIYQLVELDVEAEYDQKYRESTARQQDAIEAWLREFSVALQQVNGRKIHLMARQTALLTIALAEKIVRRSVVLDQDILVRTLQTLLYKVDAGLHLRIRVNPQDAEFLQEQTNLLQELNVTEIMSDRRIERGGCLVQAEDQEWDATIQNQLGSLSEIVEEIMGSDFPLEGELAATLETVSAEMQLAVEKLPPGEDIDTGEENGDGDNPPLE
jgi:flagellar biosynthesis/type III secretory pathway protein FliH